MRINGKIPTTGFAVMLASTLMLSGCFGERVRDEAELEDFMKSVEAEEQYRHQELKSPSSAITASRSTFTEDPDAE